MLNNSQVFSSFSTNDIEKTKDFYSNVLRLQVSSGLVGMPEIQFPSGQRVGFYSKENHQPASFTVLNFLVEDLVTVVDALIEKGVKMEFYEGFNQDEKGIARVDGSPSAAWFKDPGGNILGVFEK